MARSFASASSQWLSINQAVLTADPITMAAWIYPATTHDGTIMAITDDDSVAGRWQMVVNASNVVQAIKQNADGSQTQTISTANTYGANQWHHACSVFTSLATRYVFLDADDGNKGTGSTSVSNETGASMTSIGARKLSSTTVYFNGRIAHAAIWNAALTAAEVAKLYAGGIGVDPRSVRPDALAAYWPLLDNDGDRDWWGQFNLTATNSPTYAQHPPVLMRSTPRFVIGSGVTAPVIDTISIAGTRQVGNTLTCNATSSPGGATFAYQWYVADDISGTNQTAISGATSQTYELSYANVGAVQKLYEGLDANGEAFIACGATPTLSAIEGDETISDYISITEAAAVASIGSPFESRYIR